MLNLLENRNKKLEKVLKRKDLKEKEYCEHKVVKKVVPKIDLPKMIFLKHFIDHFEPIVSINSNCDLFSNLEKKTIF